MSLILNRRRLALGAATALAAAPFARAFAESAGAPALGFTHGVASGDPRQTSVMLWTRYVPATPGVTGLRAEVATNEAFASIVAAGDVGVSPASDYCARVVATGLPAGRWLHYRFISETGEISATGRTRTLPDSGTDRFRIAVFSCSNITSGWFNAYAHAAARDDLDLALHLGDYIYESTPLRDDAIPGMAALRKVQPGAEILSLLDYRLRHASYRADPDLQGLHARLPMITLWDDHETANNTWRAGASAHDPATEGDWNTRLSAGMHAFHEWLPAPDAWWTSYRIGDLATLFSLETRLAGRDLQLDVELAAALATPQRSRLATLQAFAKGPLAAGDRSMLGGMQERWLADGLSASTSRGDRWQILGQQVIMGQFLSPASFDGWIRPGAPDEANMRRDLAQRAQLTAAGVPYDMDKWNGYPAARQRVYDMARAARANLVALAGDSHNAWAFDHADAAGAIGVEFAGQSVSSYGMERKLNGDAAAIARAYVSQNPSMRWMDASRRGYFVLDITRDRVEAEYVFLPSKDVRSTAIPGTHTLAVEHGARRIDA
jgi:alkaline phosphatase D